MTRESRFKDFSDEEKERYFYLLTKQNCDKTDAEYEEWKGYKERLGELKYLKPRNARFRRLAERMLIEDEIRFGSNDDKKD